MTYSVSLKCNNEFIFISVQCLTNKGIPCKFPFIYKKNEYNHCIKSHFGNFCAIKVDRNSKPKYERCSDDCPTTTIAPATTTAASTTTIESDDGKPFIIVEILIF